MWRRGGWGGRRGGDFIITIPSDKRCMSSRHKFWIRLFATVLAFSLLLFAPYKSTVSPQWNIQVVDASGNPVPSLWVAEEWEYFGIDNAGNIENKQADAAGRVTFPRRAIWASLASRLLNPQGAGEKVGPSVWVLVCDETRLMQGEFFWDGERFRSGGELIKAMRIVAKPVKYCTMM